MRWRGPSKRPAFFKRRLPDPAFADPGQYRSDTPASNQ
jgi:hypothetical protein